MDTPEQTRIKGNEERQASDTIRGFLHQFWYSLHAWLELGPDDLLFLEGAEDIDVVRESDARVTQIKATATNLTLRSEDIIQAIANFWQILEKNPNRNIYYRFVSTSGIGIEKGAPFGVDKPGLEVWAACLSQPASVDDLRTFFVREDCFTGRLKTFVETAPAAALLEQLMSRISWDLRRPPWSAVEHAVEQKLINHGDRFGISPSAAKKVASRLLREIAALAASKGPRELTRGQFLEIFEEETRVSIPIAQHEASVRAMTSFLNKSLPATADVSFASAIQSGAPPLPPRFARRKAVVESIRDHLTENDLVLLQGSTGMGKTILAALAIASEKTFLWINLRGLEGRDTRAVLGQVSCSLDAAPTLKRIIFDDVNFAPDEFRHFENMFSGIVYTIAVRGGWALATSQKSLPTSVSRNLGSARSSSILIKGFDRVEIEDLALELGCPEAQVESWSKLVDIQTKRHPQLVHARLLTLARSYWPKIREKDLLETPGDLNEERAQTRMLLAHLSIHEVEILYRLSILGSVFRRDQAIGVGEIDPAVDHAGDSFDRLLGPWIEPLSEKYFRLSPLLDNAALSVWSPEKIVTLRAAIGQVLLRCGNLTTVEASNVLMQAFLSRSRYLLLVMSRSLLKHPLPFDRRLADSISWVTLFKTEPGNLIFPEDPLVNWMLRLLQFQVAVSLDKNSAGAVIECLDAETTEERMGQGYRVTRFLFLMQAMVSVGVALDPAKLLHLIGETVRVESALVAAGEDEILRSLASLRSEGGKDRLPIGTFLFQFVAARCKSVKFLEALISALRETDEGIRSHFASFFRDCAFESRLLVDKAWLDEDKRDAPDWEHCVTVLESAIDYGRDFNVPGLIEASLRAILIVCDEYLHDSRRAHIALEMTSALIKTPSPLLIDEQANLLSSEGRYAEALELWKTILPDWRVTEGSPDVSPAFGNRKAAIAAAKIDLFDLAADYFINGGRQAASGGQSVLSIGMLADAAFARWKAGKNPEAIELFIEVLQRLDEMPNTKDHQPSFKLRKTVGQMLHHLENAVAGVDIKTAYAPRPGAGSDLGESEQLNSLPLTPPDLLWMVLIQTEASLDVPPRAYERVGERLSQSDIPAVRWFTAETDICHRLRSQNLNDLPQLAQTFAALYRHLSSDKAVDPLFDGGKDKLKRLTPQLQDATLAKYILFAGLTSTVSRGRDSDALLREWRKTSEGLALHEEILAWISAAQDLLAGSSDKAIQTMRDPNNSLDARLLAALKIASDDGTDIENLFYAHVTITVISVDQPLRTRFAAHFVEMVSRQWVGKIAPRGVLHSTKAAPSIKVACEAALPPLQKLTGIMLAVHDAIAIRIPPMVENKLAELSRTPTKL